MAGKAKDLTGYTTPQGVVILKRVENKGNKPQWLCRCFCGNQFITRSDALKSGHTKSCGCLQKKKASELITAHNKNIALDLKGQRFGKLIALEPTEERMGTSIIWKCKCDCGNITYIAAKNLVNNFTFSCGCLKQSHGEYIIEQLLKQYKIPYEREYRFEDCKDKKPLPFDFYVNQQYLIEYDGNIHFFHKNNGWNNENNLQLIKKHDEIKNQWCKENNIPLIRIPYTHLNKLTINDLLLNTTDFLI